MSFMKIGCLEVLKPTYSLLWLAEWKVPAPWTIWMHIHAQSFCLSVSFCLKVLCMVNQHLLYLPLLHCGLNIEIWSLQGPTHIFGNFRGCCMADFTSRLQWVKIAVINYRSFPLCPSLPFPLFVKLSERAWSQAPIEETKLSLKILWSDLTTNRSKTYLQHQGENHNGKWIAIYLFVSAWYLKLEKQRTESVYMQIK